MYLNCHTGFSFKYGTMPPAQLFDEARRCGVRKLVLTEINNTASYMEMLRLCEDRDPGKNGQTSHRVEGHALGIAVGIEFRREHELLYIAIAKDNEGFEKLNRFLSCHNREDKSFPSRAPELDGVFVVYPLGSLAPESLRSGEYLGVRQHELRRLAMYASINAYKHKFVILHPVTFLPPRRGPEGKIPNIDFNAHRLLRAIANNTLLSKLAKHQQASPDEFMIPEKELEHIYHDFPFIVSNTRELIDRCAIDIRMGGDKNKKVVTQSRQSDLDFLTAETWKGFKTVYGENNTAVRTRIEKELRIIEKKEFTAYYLIAYDLVSFAGKKGYGFVGRGSGANSAVAYCLGITNVDPIELDLYFERFLNEERTTPPDFDIDFSWDHRDEIYDYIFSTYGHEHVCLLGTHVTYQARSIHRELGKVFGLPREEIDSLMEDYESQKDRDHIAHLVCKYASYIMDKGLPANLSIHAGGVLITERPVYAYTATQMPPKGYPVSHFEMHAAEDFGIYKFDILSQRGLGHIRETVKLVKKTRNVDVDIRRLGDFKRDEKVRALLRNGKALGCFFVESPAMRMLLRKLRCEDYPTLVAASAIIRPGVAGSGMMRAYIQRYHAARRGRTYETIHPAIGDLLSETYGVMVYQEDVIRVAHEFAGISLAEADVLRRGMSGKYRSRSEFQRVRERFYEACEKKQHDRRVVDRLWLEIESFAGYSFAKGHSASYAVESYQSLYLKAWYPLEFMVGVINNFGGFYKTEFYFHEARMNGALIEAPCVNKSEYLTTLCDKQIFAGFIHIKSLETATGRLIEGERTKNGPFKDLPDFLDRIETGLEQVRILIRIGAFRFTGKRKPLLLWEAMLHFSQTKRRIKGPALFPAAPAEDRLPALAGNEAEDAFDELELLGFPLCDPFLLLAGAKQGDTPATQLLEKVGKHVHMIGYVVTTRDTRTKTGETMHFGTFIDAAGEMFDTVHFPETARKYPFRGRGFYHIRGRVSADFDVPTISVISMDRLPMIHKRAEEFLREPAVNPARITA